MNFLINFCVNWQKQLTLNVLHRMEVWDGLSLVLIQLNLCSISSVGIQVWRGGCVSLGKSLEKVWRFHKKDGRWEQYILICKTDHVPY